MKISCDVYLYIQKETEIKTEKCDHIPIIIQKLLPPFVRSKYWIYKKIKNKLN